MNMEFFQRIFHPRFVLPLSTFGALVGGTILAKDHYGGADCPNKDRIDGKTVIVTGSNCGIGKETALELAQRGGNVILACRDLKKGEKARADIVAASGNENVKVLELDLASLSSVRLFADKVIAGEKDVHVLINNAGIMRCPKWKTEDGFEMQFGVNHLGHFYLTNLLLDKLRGSAPSRVITVSSVAHKVGEIDFDDINGEKRYNSAEAYANSKLANVLFTRELSKRLEGTGVTANIVHPGVVKTKIGRHSGMHQSGFSMAILGPIFWLFVRSPKKGAQTTIYCATDESLSNVSGEFFQDCKKSMCGATGQDDEVAAKLWEVSAEMTGLVAEETSRKDPSSEVTNKNAAKT